MTRIVNPLHVIERYKHSSPVPIFEIIREIGIALSFEPLADDISGWIERLTGKSYRIVVNANHAPSRQRFTAAHELAHYIYHRDLMGAGVGDNRAYRSEGTGRLNAKILVTHERQANTFADNVLMPREALLAIPDRSDIEGLARQFAVSPAAMRIRLGM